LTGLKKTESTKSSQSCASISIMVIANRRIRIGTACYGLTDCLEHYSLSVRYYHSEITAWTRSCRAHAQAASRWAGDRTLCSICARWFY